jgi:hypothetical protein
MTKIYAVTSGDYSDYRVNAIFTTEQKANDFKAGFPNETNFNDIEEYELDPEVPDLDGKDIWFVRMKKNGDVLETEKKEKSLFNFYYSVGEFDFDVNNDLYMTVIAKDKEHAIKIVGEKRAQIIAENGWKEIKVMK